MPETIGEQDYLRKPRPKLKPEGIKLPLGIKLPGQQKSDSESKEGSGEKTLLRAGSIILLLAVLRGCIENDILGKLGRAMGEKARTAEETLRDEAIARQFKLDGIDPTKWSDTERAMNARLIDGYQSDYLNAQRHLTPGKGSKESLEDFWATQLAPNEKGGYGDRQTVSGMALIHALQQQGLAGKTCDRTALGQNIQKKLGYDPNDISRFLDNEDKFCRFLQGQPGGKGILGAIPASQARTHLAVTGQHELRRRSNADWKQNAKVFRSVRRS